MNHLWTDTGYVSINHVGEQLCGDRVEIIGDNENSVTLVFGGRFGKRCKSQYSFYTDQ